MTGLETQAQFGQLFRNERKITFLGFAARRRRARGPRSSATRGETQPGALRQPALQALQAPQERQPIRVQPVPCAGAPASSPEAAAVPPPVVVGAVDLGRVRAVGRRDQRNLLQIFLAFTVGLVYL